MEKDREQRSWSPVTIVRPNIRLITPPEWFDRYAEILEIAGRECYQSEPKGDPEKFIKGIIARGHESVIEHLGIIVEIICDRSTSHQLVRHRVDSHYSQMSQRFVDMTKNFAGIEVVCPPSVRKDCRWGTYYKDPDTSCWYTMLDSIQGVRVYSTNQELNSWLDMMSKSFDDYKEMRANGVLPEDARSVLPNACVTKIVTSFGLRQWRHVFEERALNPKAQWEIRYLMKRCLAMFYNQGLSFIFEDQFKRLNTEGFDPVLFESMLEE